jgi:RHS repeat-associated protein
MYKLNPLRFSAKYQDDETHFSYYGYRYYGPEAGRPVSRDPAEEAESGNLYTLLSNDPIQHIDALGRESLEFSSEGRYYLNGSWAAGMPAYSRIGSESGKRASPDASFSQWAVVLQVGNSTDLGICNSTLQAPGAHHPNSFVVANIKNKSKCKLRINCDCSVSYSIKAWADTRQKAALIFGHVLSVGIGKTYAPEDMSSQSVPSWMAQGSDTISVGLGFILAPGEKRELYYAAPNLAVWRPRSGFSEDVSGSCTCSEAD